MKIRRFVTIFLAALAPVTFMGPVASAETVPPSQSNPQETIAAASPDVDGIIANAKTNDAGFSARRDLIATSTAFVHVLKKTTGDYQRSLDYFTAISTDQQAADLVAKTAGKHYVISGTMSNPDVRLVDGEVSETSSSADSLPQEMPRCGKAWAAFDSWLAGTTMFCAPCSGPAAWGCAVAMGFLGLMPDFNAACD